MQDEFAGHRAYPLGNTAEVPEPTVFPELNEVLDELVRSAREALGDNFCGAYLQGSFAVGDADEHSDVDFVIVTNDELTAAEETALQAMHERIYELESPWAQHLEGSYIPKRRLRRTDPAREPYLYLDNGATELVRDNHDNTAVVRWSLREHGVVLTGPDPKSLVDPVPAEELRRNALEAMGEWESFLRERDAPMGRRLQGLLVLSYCRMLHTLATGRVTSKREAGEWALGALEREWAGLIQGALDDRPDPWRKVHEPADPDAAERSLAFMAYARDAAATIDGS
jgi:predicted nucleotidyltransferase